MVDRAVYTDDAHTPKLALRQIFGRLGTPSALCKAAADKNLLSVETLAVLGETISGTKATMKLLWTDLTDLGADEPAPELALMSLAVW